MMEGARKESESQSVWLHTRRPIYLSAILDLLVLQAFVSVGMVAWWIPWAHTFAVIGGCLIYELVLKTGVPARFAAAAITPYQVTAGLCVEGSFMLLAPAATSYFVGLVFYIFSFAGLILRRRDAVFTWGLATVAIVLTLLLQPDAMTQGWTVPQRVVVSLGIALNLARCTWMALWGTRLRGHLLEKQRRRRNELWNELHEDLGQQLAGVSLMLSAVANRLAREDHPTVQDVKHATAQLAKSIAKVRSLSAGLQPRAGQGGRSHCSGAAGDGLPATGLPAKRSPGAGSRASGSPA